MSTASLRACGVAARCLKDLGHIIGGRDRLGLLGTDGADHSVLAPLIIGVLAVLAPIALDELLP